MATSPKLFEIADTLAKLTVLEAKELLIILEKDYGIKGDDAVIPIDIRPTIEVQIEQTEFNIYLKETGGQRLQVIKKVNELLGLGLKESKELVDKVPCLIREKTNKVEAQLFKNEFENLGAVIEIR